MKALQHARLRKFITALAVVFLHAIAVRAVLGVRTFYQLAERQQTTVTWIVLPPEPARDAPPSRITATALSMAPLAGTSGTLGVPTSVTAVPLLVSPLLAQPAPTLPANPDAHVLSTIGDYFSCNFLSYDDVPEAERERCALRLSNLGEIAPLTSGYVENKVTPFKLFGAQGTFAITPPAKRPYDLLLSSIGCAWEQGLCRLPQPDKFGLDPDDQKRLTAAAHFELASGLSLDVGGQAFMENYLGGARPIFATGVVLTYRW